MILQALVRHYEDLAGQGKIARPGWSNSNISFALHINSAGELVQVADIRESPEKGKPRPQAIQLPSPPTGRTSMAVKPAFLWDNAKYLLGIDSKGKQQQSLKCFEGSKEFYHQLLDGVDSPASHAVLAFFDRWDPEQAENHPALVDKRKDILSGANMVLRYHGGYYVHDDPLVRQAWQDYYDRMEDGPEMVCLVTGKKGPVERIHPKVKKVGDPSWQTMGNTLVGFNADSFCSYGKEQSFNAPTSKYAAFAYTSALNHLLADRDHLHRIGDTTVVCWAEGGEPVFQDAFGAFTFGVQSNYTETELRGMVGQLLCGNSVSFDETLLDPDRPFYILGLAPNAARLSVRFFLRDSFGGFLKNVQRHYEQIEIAKPTSNKPDISLLDRRSKIYRFDSGELDTLPLDALLMETVNQNSRDKSASPNMAGGVLRSILMDEPYPATLLHGALLRIRAERKVTRGRVAIVKAYYLKRPHPDIPKEVLTVSLNSDSTNIPYTLGRLFSVLESVQSSANPGINATIKDRYFNAASAAPGHVFPILLNLSQKHLRKLEGGLRVYYEKQITELTGVLSEAFPSRLNLPQQGAFQLGYYHQTQKRYEKKEETPNV